MKYAIVESGGKQYRAVEGGTLEVDRLPVEAGEAVKLEQTLLLADGESITVGTPLVKDSPVWTKVVEHFKGEKVTIFNYSPKKRIRVKTGHRQNYTRLLVEQIGGSELVKREASNRWSRWLQRKLKTASCSKAEKPAKPDQGCGCLEREETGCQSPGKGGKSLRRKDEGCPGQDGGKETRQAGRKTGRQKACGKKTG